MSRLPFERMLLTISVASTIERVVDIAVEYTQRRLLDGMLDEEAANMSKWWTTERQCKATDECPQIGGGYGYATKFPIARM